jgi:hypothetical protein
MFAIPRLRPRCAPRCALVSLFLATPLLITSGALAGLGASLADCVAVWGDEVIYWNEINTFARAGWNGGYCTYEEMPCRAAWCHFGPHGPAFPLLYGSVARLTGWRPASGPFFNLAALALSCAMWLWVVRPDVRTLAVGTLLVGTFWPLVLYLPTTMQEGLHFAFAFAIAAAVQPWTADKPGPGRLWLPPLVIGLASTVRPTWALVLPVWGLLAARRLPRRALALALLASIVAVPAIVLALGPVTAPYPNKVTAMLEHARTSRLLAWLELKELLRADWTILTSPADHLLTIAQRIELAGLIGLTGSGIVLCPASRRSCWFAFASLALFALPCFTIYITESYRVVQPQVLLALLVLLASGVDGRRLATVVVAVHLALVPAAWSMFRYCHGERVKTVAPSTELFEGVRFDPDTPDPWDNTLDVSLGSLDSYLLAAPAGVGITPLVEDMPGYSPHHLRDWRKETPRARYLLLGPYAPADAVERWRLRFVRHLPGGELYVRDDRQ